MLKHTAVVWIGVEWTLILPASICRNGNKKFALRLPYKSDVTLKQVHSVEFEHLSDRINVGYAHVMKLATWRSRGLTPSP